MPRIWIVAIQASKLPNWWRLNMGFYVLNINMLLAVVDMQHEFSCVNNGLWTEPLIIYPFSYDFFPLSHHSLAIAYVSFFYNFYLN